MKRLTEQQLRNVIREEIKNVLFEQEEENKNESKSKFFRLVIPAIAIAMSLAQGHTSQSLAGDGNQDGSGKTQSNEELMAQQGINPNEAENLFNLAGFDEASSKKLSGIFSQLKQNSDGIKQLEKSLKEKDLPENNPVRIKAEQKISDLLQSSKELDKAIANDEKISKGLLEAGPMALQYLFNKGALTGDQKEDYKRMLKYGIENAPLIAAQEAEKDLQIYANNLGILSPMSAGEKIIGWLGTEHPEIAQELTTNPDGSWTNIELLKTLKKLDNNFKPKTFEYFDPEGVAINTAQQLLDNPANSYDASEVADAMAAVKEAPRSKEYNVEKMTDEEINSIKDVETRQALKAEKAKLKESKVSKLRQRLNELRGVYV